MKTTSAQQAEHQVGNAVTRAPGLPDYHRTFNEGVSNSALVQRQVESSQRENRPEANDTGLPDHLKTNMELFSGYTLRDVKVHYNSSKPASVNALAFAQGTDIHLAPGQEQHLPHELWHVVQQKQGRVRPTFQMKSGVQVNADDALEAEADVMGHRMSGMKAEAVSERSVGGNERSLFNIGSTSSSAPLQMKFSQTNKLKFKKAVEPFINKHAVEEKYQEEIRRYASVLREADQIYTLEDAIAALEKKLEVLTAAPAEAITAAPVEVKEAAPVEVKEAAPVEVKEAVPAEVKEAVPAEVKEAVPAEVKEAASAKFNKHADQRGAMAAAKLIAKRKDEVSKAAEIERTAADLKYENDAIKTLTKKDSKRWIILEGKPIDLQGKLKAKRKEFAAKEVEKITKEEEEKKATVDKDEGPAEEARVRGSYQDYFTRVNFHPDALNALKVVGEDIPLATLLIDALVTAPGTRPLFLGNITTTKIRRLVPEAATLKALMEIGVTIAAISNFGDNDNDLALLLALHRANVPFARINNIAPLLKNLADYFSDDIAIGHLTTLLVHYDPADIKRVLDAAPDPKSTRAKLVHDVRQKAASTEDLIKVLALCTRFKFEQTRVGTCLTTEADGSELKVLKEAVGEEHLNRFDKMTKFTEWLTAVGDVVTEKIATITKDDKWVELKSRNPNMVTSEMKCKVTLTNGSVRDFCVHLHPYADKATQYNTGASRKHFKPESIGIYKIPYENGPPIVLKELR
ncbi:eCIS core domain-containing protein [Undibacterium sp. Ji50W]|uniref:eCIS core domain-containing protein n=1 Tax=Undibacterium sp. Ji50W TaxID=3413041 RepID=UPI003BF3BA09